MIWRGPWGLVILQTWVWRSSGSPVRTVALGALSLRYTLHMFFRLSEAGVEACYGQNCLAGSEQSVMLEGVWWKMRSGIRRKSGYCCRRDSGAGLRFVGT